MKLINVKTMFELINTPYFDEAAQSIYPIDIRFYRNKVQYLWSPRYNNQTETIMSYLLRSREESFELLKPTHFTQMVKDNYSGMFYLAQNDLAMTCLIQLLPHQNSFFQEITASWLQTPILNFSPLPYFSYVHLFALCTGGLEFLSYLIYEKPSIANELDQADLLITQNHIHFARSESVLLLNQLSRSYKGTQILFCLMNNEVLLSSIKSEHLFDYCKPLNSDVFYNLTTTLFGLNFLFTLIKTNTSLMDDISANQLLFSKKFKANPSGFYSPLLNLLAEGQPILTLLFTYNPRLRMDLITLIEQEQDPIFDEVLLLLKKKKKSDGNLFSFFSVQKESEGGVEPEEKKPSI